MACAVAMLTPLWSLAARVHIAGDGSVRQLVYSDGSTDLATLSGGDGFLNSSATVHATNFVTQAGADMNTIQEMIGNLSATAASQQAELSTLSAEVQALKEFVGMTPPAGPPALPPPGSPPSPPPALPLKLVPQTTPLNRLSGMYATGYSRSRAMWGNYAVVGAEGYRKVWIFEKDGSGSWPTTPVATLNYAAQAAFGLAVAIYEDDVFVCANSADCKCYIFQRVGGIWSTTAVAIIDGYQSETEFGHSVAIDGNYAFVGSNFNAFMFQKTGNTWSTTAVATFPGGSNGWGRVAMHGDFAVVHNGVTMGVYQNVAGTWGSSTVATIPFNGVTEMALYGDYIIAGAYVDGRIAFFKKTGGIWSTTAVTTLTLGQYFGVDVALFGDYALVGRYGANEALIYQNVGGTWSTTPYATIASPSDNTRPDFGRYVTFSRTSADAAICTSTNPGTGCWWF